MRANMRVLFNSLIALTLALPSAATAQNQSLLLSGSQGASTAPAYVGPGDVPGASGALAFYGLRAYTAAYIGGNAFDITRASDSTVLTINTVAGGGVDTAAAATFCTATTCTVTKMYDQTGNGYHLTCAGCNAVQIPFYKANCFGSLPCWDVQGTTSDSGGTVRWISAGTFTPAVTNTMYGVWNDYSINTGPLGSFKFANMDMIFTTTGNKPDLTSISHNVSGSNRYDMEVYCGTGGPLYFNTTIAADSITIGVIHFAVGECNGASSLISLDGVDVTGQGGADTYAAWNIQGPYMSVEVSRYIADMSYYDGILHNGTVRAAVRSNERAYWGF